MVVYSERPASMYSQLQVMLHCIAASTLHFTKLWRGFPDLTLSSSHEHATQQGGEDVSCGCQEWRLPSTSAVCNKTCLRNG